MCKSQLVARLIAVLSLLLMGCADGAMRHDGTVVAEVGDAKLTSAMVPAEVFAYGGQDSLTLLRAYAERWATQQAVYQQAVRRFAGSRADIESRVEDYRQTLTIADYERQLVFTQLDTLVTQEAIEAFYRANADHFILHQPLVRCFSLAVPESNVLLKELRAVYTLRGEEALARMEPLMFKAGVMPATSPKVWIPAALLGRTLGVEIAEGALSQRPARLDFTRDSVVYLVAFHEWMDAGAVAPVDYVREDIKAMLLNQRRKRLVDSLERSIADMGRAEGRVKIFVE